MRGRKRGGGDLRRSSIDNKRTSCGSGETTKPLISGLGSDLCEELASKLSKSVVLLVLSDGHRVIFSCSGVAIGCNRFLTSGSLVRARNKEAKDHDNMKIEVRYEGNVVIGFLEECDLDHEFSVVKITSILNVRAVFLNPALTFMPHCEVVSLGREVSGNLLAISGKLKRVSVGSDENGSLVLSSCKLPEVWDGGAIFDSDGHFAGMIVVPSMGIFLPHSLIIERLEHFRTSQTWPVFLEHLKMARVGERVTDDLSHPEVYGDAPSKGLNGDLVASGYPGPPKSGMILVNTFEEPFGDIYCKCVWRQLDKRVSKMINRNVVSLASFKGDTIFFACSGFVIDWDDEYGHNGHQTVLTSAYLIRNPEYPFDGGNKIVDGLRIDVLLPNLRHREGTLIHYNLHYNVALISVRKSCSVSHVVLKHENVNQSSKVVAVGRCFKSGNLMASIGKPIVWSSPFDFKKFPYGTTCEITKAGIGGPLVDVDGHYIGMNLYHPEAGTPFLFCDDIVDMLDSFKNRAREGLTDQIPYSHSANGKDRHKDLEASYYFRPSKIAMNLVDTLAEPFGDTIGRCAWRQLDKRVSNVIIQNVVSIASFTGDRRFFACSGIVIHWDDGCGDSDRQIILTSACLVRNRNPFDDGNKIVDGLRIEVLLPDRQQREGTLIRYNLHYNVALVSVRKFCASPAVILCKQEVRRRNHSSKVVAVGRCFKSCNLMASSGKLVNWSGPFDCKKLRYSTCKITKAGIGGPLVDVCGNYIGMNFYDPHVGTPVLFCDDVAKILDCFKKRSGAEADNFRIDGDDNGCLNKWPVPKPYWCYPGESDDINQDKHRVLDWSRRFRC